MQPGMPQQVVDEVECGLGKHEVMREEPRRLVRVARMRAPCGKMRGHPLERRVGADERAIAPPGNRVDVRVDLRKARRCIACRARSEARESGEAGRRQVRQQRIARTVPRRHEDRRKTLAECLRKSGAAAVKLVQPGTYVASVAESGRSR